jgi:hypothetical protein
LARRRHDRRHHRLLASLTTAAFVAAGCIGQPNPTTTPPGATAFASRTEAARIPTPRPTAAASRVDLGCDAIVAAVTPTRPPETPPPPPSPTIANSDTDSVRSIAAAAQALIRLPSYRMSVDLIGVNPSDFHPTSLDLGVRGTVRHDGGFAMDALIGTRMREPDNSAAISGGAQYVAGNGLVWATDNVSEVLEPISDPSLTAFLVLVTPDGLADRAIVPFAGGYRLVGPEMHGGVRTVHYQATKSGVRAYATTFGFPGSLTADLWIASDGGHIVGARIAGTSKRTVPSASAAIEEHVEIGFTITDPDGPANIVELPAIPVPDPVRPTTSPVDLKLQVQVMPSNGTKPTAAEIDEMAVSLRYRLHVSERPVKVDSMGEDRLRVTVCGTTSPDEDRNLVVARGALTAVPLPAADYGTKAAPGPKALPSVGGQIDPALQPVAPAAGNGISRPHVDPVTGQRGLALHLGNAASDAFRAYASAHPGEYVAVVLDGVVLAVLPIEGLTAKGTFVFTGDYTEDEARLLVSWINRNPMPFELRSVDDVEVPSR